MNSHNNASSKILFGIIIFGWSFSVSISNVNIQEAIAAGGGGGAGTGAITTTRINDPTISQLPLYIELDKTTSRKAVDINGATTITHATEVTFSGNGTAKHVKY